MKQLIIDPPSGWKYGFPKILPKTLPMWGLNTWLVEQGYPKEEIDKLGEHFYCNYYTQEEDMTNGG